MEAHATPRRPDPSEIASPKTAACKNAAFLMNVKCLWTGE